MSDAVATITPRTDADVVEMYERRGLPFVVWPSEYGKGPREARWTEKRHRAADWQPGKNVGIFTGTKVESGGHLAAVDFDWPPGVGMARSILPETGFGIGRPSKSPSQAFYTTPNPEVSKRFEDPENGTPFVELRGTKTDGSIGLQSMVAPSVHPSGERVELVMDGEIGHADDLPRRVALYATACILSKYLGPRGLQHDVRLAVAGFLLRLGLTEAEVIAVCTAVAKQTGNDAADVAPSVRDTARKIRDGERVTGAGAVEAAIGEDGKRVTARIREWFPADADAAGDDGFPCTEAGDAEFFADRNAGRVCFDHRRGRWLVFDRHSWVPQSTGEVMRVALDTMRDRQRLAVGDKDRVRWALAGESRKRLTNLLAIAQNILPIADAGDNWDADPWLLGVSNGVVDLRTGALRPGTPEDRITMLARAAFDPDAACPLYDRTVYDIFQGDQALIDYFDRYVGYGLTGDCREESLAFCYGDGANGKGTLINTIAWMLGDYADDLPFSAFELHSRAGIPNDIAKLVGKRFVTASESGETQRLNEPRVKALTGRDPITARFLHREFFTFQPQAKFWLATNHKPEVHDDSEGFWRRLHLIPFEASFVGREDKTLKDRLRDELPGILARAVRGCLAWQREGLNPPPRVRDATKSYRAQSSPLARFLDDRCVVGDGMKVAFGDLFKSYVTWAGSAARMGKHEFSQAVRGQFQQDLNNRERVVFLGVGLADHIRDGEGQ